MPRVRLHGASRAARRALAAWLKEWAIFLALEKQRGEGPPRAYARGASARVVKTSEPPLAAGQIRLLQPRGPAARDRLRYFAVLDLERSGDALIAPFGPLAVPATPGELRTRERALGVRVLCLWNARRVPACRIGGTWFVGWLDAVTLSEARAVRECLARGEEQSWRRAARAGPPLRHPLDPRQVYLARERAGWDELLGEESAAAATASYPCPVPSALAWAAEERASYRPGARTERYRRGGGPAGGKA